MHSVHCVLCIVLVFPTLAHARPRARDLGVPFDGTTGPRNAITDVKGVEVGHATLISGKGKLQVGTGPVRTGVTAILPRGRSSSDPVFAGWFSLNGNGEMTGTAWIDESGFLEGPVMLTNTTSVGTVRDATVKWLAKNVKGQQDWSLPVVAETYDGYLNDTLGFHVKEKHVFAALDSARAGAVAEGNVGGGTGMTCFEFKGGIGTASRKLPTKQGGYTVGVLVQANFGQRHQLQVAGVPVGRQITDGILRRKKEAGSIIIVVATDSPLLPHQLKRLARRAALGLARTGSVSGNGSGDLFLAFSTANPKAAKKEGVVQVRMLPHERMDPLFAATVQATEEAIINALVAATTMIGRDDHKVLALPHDQLRAILKKHNRLAKPASGQKEEPSDKKDKQKTSREPRARNQATSWQRPCEAPVFTACAVSSAAAACASNRERGGRPCVWRLGDPPASASAGRPGRRRGGVPCRVFSWLGLSRRSVRRAGGWLRCPRRQSGDNSRPA
jgi:L-aminopeptidase/D-esterase-like protein